MTDTSKIQSRQGSKPAFLARLAADRSGNILIITGLCFLFLVGIGGAGYDFGRQQLIRQKLQQASDAAALGAAGKEGLTTAQRETMANVLFQLNFPDTYLGVARPTPTINVVPDANVLVTASVSVDTSFVGNFNVETLQAKGRSIAQISTNINKIDLIITMDNSGSMRRGDVGAASFMNADINAASSRCQVSYWTPAQTAYILANYPTPAAPNPVYLDAYRIWCQQPNNFNYNNFGRDVKGLVGATRLNALRHSADYISNLLLNNPSTTGMHRVAVVKWDNSLIGFDDFTSNYGAVKTSLLNMYAGVDTKSQVGLQKSEDLASGFRNDAVHAVVLLTDGQNNNPGVDNPASLALCNTLKSRPRTLVFTVAFGSVATDPTVRQFLSDCATGPNGAGQPNENLYFYAAPDATKLQAAFDAIAGNLQKVRILQ